LVEGRGIIMSLCICILTSLWSVEADHEGQDFFLTVTAVGSPLKGQRLTVNRPNPNSNPNPNAHSPDDHTH